VLAVAPAVTMDEASSLSVVEKDSLHFQSSAVTVIFVIRLHVRSNSLNRSRLNFQANKKSVGETKKLPKNRDQGIFSTAG